MRKETLEQLSEEFSTIYDEFGLYKNAFEDMFCNNPIISYSMQKLLELHENYIRTKEKVENSGYSYEEIFRSGISSKNESGVA